MREKKKDEKLIKISKNCETATKSRTYMNWENLKKKNRNKPQVFFEVILIKLMSDTTSEVQELKNTPSRINIKQINQYLLVGIHYSNF